ncbi:hypothetical protein V5F32_07280 [Xanthobacter oligotrophicus]|uniref:Uncharacterized protein n=1 Tax=Xanthobacter oligotrophicus TaxID=2607286 RepID=A0ABW6ZTB5_9HYPH
MAARKPAATVETAAGASGPAASPAQARPARDWLERADAVPPEVWLAARSSSPADPARMAALLKEADALFDETPRMLANRTAQLQRMLAGKAVTEPPQELLEDFIRLAREDARPGRRSGFGDLCQHYYNLRASGLGRLAALEALARAGQGSLTP